MDVESAEKNMSAGDQVSLKSGGPIMTIKWIDGNEVYCEWFANNTVVGHSFVRDQLEKVE
jgi:uncharacterized protein YodC (DUF2158 family)